MKTLPRRIQSMGQSVARRASAALLLLAVTSASQAQGRRGSGTSLVPDTAPMSGWHFGAGEWHLMLHGFVNAVYQNESGIRGRSEWFTTDMAMFHAERGVGSGRLELRAMASLEPALGAEGYPLLLQTGESADGRNPLFDRQHPHDLMMELSVRYRRGPLFVYFAPVGEPALGPPAFMHRASASHNPTAPISHHWLDATHISYGVVTLGVAPNARFQLEASVFNGREPDTERWGFEPFRLDSFSGRVTWSVSPRWTLQASAAKLHEPDRLHPGLDVVRVSASAIYNRPLARGNWQTTLAWGLNDTERLTAAPTFLPPGAHVHFTPGVSPYQNALLAETELRFAAAHAVFSRFEWAQKDELFRTADRRHDLIFGLAKLSAGYAFDVLRTAPVRAGVGGYVSFYRIDEQLALVYGEPLGLGIFLRVAIE